MANLRYLRDVATRTLRTKFKSNKGFRVEIDDIPTAIDLDYHIMDATHCIVEIETKQLPAGMKRINLPTTSQQVDLTLTIRDDEDETIRDFFVEWSNKIDNGDGTANPPADYLKKVRRFKRVTSSPIHGFHLTGENRNELIQLDRETKKAPKNVETDEWDMFVTKIGDQVESLEESGHHTYTVTLTGFRS